MTHMIHIIWERGPANKQESTHVEMLGTFVRTIGYRAIYLKKTIGGHRTACLAEPDIILWVPTVPVDTILGGVS